MKLPILVPIGGNGSKAEALEGTAAEDGIDLAGGEQQRIECPGLADERPDVLGRAHVGLGDVLLVFRGDARLGEIDEAVLRAPRLDHRHRIAVLRRGHAADARLGVGDPDSSSSPPIAPGSAGPVSPSWAACSGRRRCDFRAEAAVVESAAVLLIERRRIVWKCGTQLHGPAWLDAAQGRVQNLRCGGHGHEHERNADERGEANVTQTNFRSPAKGAPMRLLVTRTPYTLARR